MPNDSRQYPNFDETIPLDDFVEDVVGSGLFKRGHVVFSPQRLELWLRKHEWIEKEGPCERCRRLSFFSEEQCRENVHSGGTCYRDTLRLILVPMVRLMLNSQAPRLRELGKKVHVRAPVHHDGMDNLTLFDVICHELT